MFLPLERVKRNIMEETNWENEIEDLYLPLEAKVDELLDRNYHLTMQLNALRDAVISRLGLKEGQELVRQTIGEA